MILLAHIMGVPVEEVLVPWVSGGLGAAVVAALAILKTKVLSH
ncbi:MAG TPA: hypothetical protein VHX17_05640 [Candidatus Cybelea sp.]|jgi:hypothetical protein|nr:hypothetical protein [Candidatus Cybelea sp.]